MGLFLGYMKSGTMLGFCWSADFVGKGGIVYPVGRRQSAWSAFPKPQFHNWERTQQESEVVMLVCGKENLIPEIWDVWEEDWEKTKEVWEAICVETN